LVGHGGRRVGGLGVPLPGPPGGRRGAVRRWPARSRVRCRGWLGGRGSRWCWQ
jgi:hypothetical protein